MQKQQSILNIIDNKDDNLVTKKKEALLNRCTKHGQSMFNYQLNQDKKLPQGKLSYTKDQSRIPLLRKEGGRSYTLTSREKITRP